MLVQKGATHDGGGVKSGVVLVSMREKQDGQRKATARIMLRSCWWDGGSNTRRKGTRRGEVVDGVDRRKKKLKERNGENYVTKLVNRKKKKKRKLKKRKYKRNWRKKFTNRKWLNEGVDQGKNNTKITKRRELSYDSDDSEETQEKKLNNETYFAKVLMRKK